MPSDLTPEVLECEACGAKSKAAGSALLLFLDLAKIEKRLGVERDLLVARQKVNVLKFDLKAGADKERELFIARQGVRLLEFDLKRAKEYEATFLAADAALGGQA